MLISSSCCCPGQPALLDPPRLVPPATHPSSCPSRPRPAVLGRLRCVHLPHEVHEMHGPVCRERALPALPRPPLRRLRRQHRGVSAMQGARVRSGCVDWAVRAAQRAGCRRLRAAARRRARQPYGRGRGTSHKGRSGRRRTRHALGSAGQRAARRGSAPHRSRQASRAQQVRWVGLVGCPGHEPHETAEASCGKSQ